MVQGPIKYVDVLILQSDESKTKHFCVYLSLCEDGQLDEQDVTLFWLSNITDYVQVLVLKMQILHNGKKRLFC